MNLDNLSAEELINKFNTLTDNPSDLEKALHNKLAEVKEEVEKAEDLLVKVTNTLEAASEK